MMPSCSFVGRSRLVREYSRALPRPIIACLALVSVPLFLGCANKTVRPEADAGPRGTRYYGLGATPQDASSDDVLVEGIVDRAVAEDAWNGEFAPQADAHIVLTILRGTRDARSRLQLTREKQLVYRQELPFEYLPFSFEVKGNREIWVAAGDEFLFYVDVLNHAGNEFYAGDLINEEPAPFHGTKYSLNVGITGLEACVIPHASLCAERVPEGGIPVPEFGETVLDAGTESEVAPIHTPDASE
jgi:hypothetical protein